MTLAEANPAAREAAAAVAMVERAPYRGRDRARTRADFDDTAVRVVSHHHPARVARDAPRRFRGNARAVFEERLAGLIGVGKDRRIDVDDDLVALSRRAGIEAVVQGGLGEQRQSVGLLLGHRRGLRGSVRLLILRLARPCQSEYE